MATARQKAIAVEALRHQEAKRRNIPTAEFESLVPTPSLRAAGDAIQNSIA